MSLAPLLDASPAIQLHAFTAIAAFFLGAVQLAAPKGTISAPYVRLPLGRVDADGLHQLVLDP